MARRKYRRKRRPRRMRRSRKYRIQKTLLGNSRVVKQRYCIAGQQPVGDFPGEFALTESFRLLSPTNPNVSTLETSQPLGFDQMNLLFSNCQVLGAKCRLTYLPSSGHHQLVYWASIEKESRQGNPSVNLGDILNRRNTTYKYSMQNPGSTHGTVLTRKHSPKRFNAFKDYKDASEYMCFPATQVLNPLFENYLNFGFSTTHPGTGAAAAAIDYVLVIDYIIRWYGPIQPPPS